MYDPHFYARTASQGLRGGQVLADFLDQAGIKPTSIADVGGGAGGWLVPFMDRGIRCWLVDSLSLEIVRELPEGIEYREQNLDGCESVDLPASVDLAICVEVLEHLSEQSALRIIRDLASRCETVVFSAAWAGQGGEHHVNEQSLDYWTSAWTAHGFRIFDVLRLPLAAAGLPSYYQTNVFMATRSTVVASALAATPDLMYFSTIGIPDVRSSNQRVVGGVLRMLPTGLVSTLSRLRRRRAW